MINEEMVKGVVERARQFLDEHERDSEFRYLKKTLDVTDTEIVAIFVFYDVCIGEYANEVYDNLPIRFVQYIHSRSTGSWHVKKAELMSQFINSAQHKSVVDIGYGIPSKYVRDILHDGRNVHVTLGDKYASAKVFSEVLLSYLDNDWRQKVSLLQIDLDDCINVGPQDAYVLLDSIEHATDPTGVFNKLVSEAPSEARFYLSLPIGKKVPVHNIEWLSEQEALDWVREAGCLIEGVRVIRPNPTVDLFVGAIEGDLFNVIIEAKKIT